MANSLLRTDKEIAELYERHQDTIYRVCFAYMKNVAVDADGYLQTNILDTAKVFFIGKDKAQAFVDYVTTNGTATPIEVEPGASVLE